MEKKILAIIPARGGSKSIPRKNIKDLAGKPMIAYIIKTVQKVRDINRIIVSTEDKEIATVAKQWGAEVPFLRPERLATDKVPTLPVLQHVLEELKNRENYIPDYVLLVYPTSPLLRPERIQDAITLALTHDAESVVSGTLVKGHYWQKTGDEYHRLYPVAVENRQLTVPLFKENGALYLNKTAVLSSRIVGETMWPLLMEEGETVDVDEPADFQQVEKIMLSR
ncbi:MAG: acylneuraminate cytidylyltransferase family protein [Candidatus Magasanikbacteria bacterium]|nr:acylneuraminate cytidylyltransferase family protein [Candidatus Magasanikbacteria bacterium]